MATRAANQFFVSKWLVFAMFMNDIESINVSLRVEDWVAFSWRRWAAEITSGVLAHYGTVSGIEFLNYRRSIFIFLFTVMSLFIIPNAMLLLASIPMGQREYHRNKMHDMQLWKFWEKFLV
eukprot:2175310-Amphidinium_carterae.1